MRSGGKIELRDHFAGSRIVDAQSQIARAGVKKDGRISFRPGGAAGVTACIIPTMAEKCSSMKRILTLSMPFYLVWALLACVSVCASHIEERCEDESSYSLATTLASADNDCCTMTRAIAESPERFSVNVGGGLCSASDLLQVGETSLRKTYIFNSAAAHSPPFERLCILRI